MGFRIRKSKYEGEEMYQQQMLGWGIRIRKCQSEWRSVVSSESDSVGTLNQEVYIYV